MQTLESWTGFLETDQVVFGGNGGEIYFEEDRFDAFAGRLKTLPVQYVHPVKEHPWGQRVVRFYDPDRHIIEVGEAMSAVCRRFLDSGLTPEEAAGHHPKVVFVDAGNKIQRVTSYEKHGLLQDMEADA